MRHAMMRLPSRRYYAAITRRQHTPIDAAAAFISRQRATMSLRLRLFRHDMLRYREERY